MFVTRERIEPPVRSMTTVNADVERASIVGQRIRHRRIQEGRSLREQAREIGISASSLSDIENSRGGISLRRLQRVADHLGFRLTELFAEPDAPDGQVESIEVIRDCPASAPGVQRGPGVLYQLLGRPHGHMIEPYLISFEPDGTFEDDMIAHPGEEFFYVLLGEIELLIGGEVHRLAQGDLVRFRTETPHAFRNASSVGIGVALGAATPPW
jgi:transcriptional regulator with XRE-family HTH domain